MAFRFSRIRRRFVHCRPSLVGAVGTIFVAVFLSVSSTILAPLRCDGQQTVQSYQQVVCWNSDNGLEHRNMVVAAAFASLVPVGFISLCVWVVVSLSSRMRQGDTVFLHTFAFLLFRFRPGAQRYVLVVMLRNFAVVSVPIVFDTSLELFVLAVVLVLCVLTSVTTRLWPCIKQFLLTQAQTWVSSSSLFWRHLQRTTIRKTLLPSCSLSSLEALCRCC